MLSQLNISDFAIIKDLDLNLRPGLNILSGETGAGKSIIINAVNLILGGRASGELIRDGSSEARVEALFEPPRHLLLDAVMEEEGIPFDGELLIKRIVSREGRNKILINGSMATLGVLARLGERLISISGQHEHQVLLRPEHHLVLLDDFGGLSEKRRALAGVYNQYHTLGGTIRSLEQEIQEISDRQELTEYQIQEIERAQVNPGEDEQLTGEKRRLQHAEELLETVMEGQQGLYERQDSVFAAVAQVSKKLEKAAAIDPGLEPIRDVLAEIQAKVEDAAYELRDFQKTIDTDPGALETVAERLELLKELKRKYGGSLEEVLRFREELSSQMFHLEGKRARLAELSEEQETLASQLQEQARDLSRKRQEAAGRLEQAAEQELHQLHMQRTRFEVRFHRDGEDADMDRIGADGADSVEFMIAPNVGEELKPLSKIASGGELSRIMLAMKTILARTGEVETVIFDEVDSGISGATAEVIGEKLRSLADYHQILCITHLPQIAAQGHTHFLVRKEVVDRRTQTAIAELDPEERVMEIARLLAGREITRQAVAHARDLLG